MNGRGDNDGVDGSSDLCGWLVRRAARSAPDGLSERLLEEWLADMGMRSGTLSRLRFALGCLWATRVIVLEHAAADVSVVGAPAGVTTAMEAQGRFAVGFFARRTTTFGLVALLHVAVFYAFMTGLATSFVKQTTMPLQNRTLSDTHPKDLPPPPRPNINPVKLELPTLDANVPIADDSTQEVIRAETAPVQLPPQKMQTEVVSQHVAKLLQGGPGAGFPLPDDFYPSLARHLEEQGVATVKVCVDAQGRLAADPTLLDSSGSLRLDAGALNLARAGSGHYRPSTEDGRPVSSCYPFRIRFQIKNF